MQNFTRNLLTEWRKLKLPFSNQNIIIAVSGGADSTALAFAMSELFNKKKLRNKFIIAHFNHKLRKEESENDANFVKNFAKSLNFDFVLGTAQKDEINTSKNIEQSARVARYKFLQKTAIKTHSQIILTAHTVNDQAETFLLNLFRGSGIEGLVAMKPIRNLNSQNEIKLVRPFLNWAKRTDIEKFVLENKINFREDLMNNDQSFKRVQIRKSLIPKLKEYNPNIIEILANTSQNLGKENDLINELIGENEGFQSFSNSPTLTIKELRELSEPKLYKLLRIWLEKKRGNLRSLEQKHLKAIRDLIYSRKSGKIVELPKFEKVIKEKGKLIFQFSEVEKRHIDNYN